MKENEIDSPRITKYSNNGIEFLYASLQSGQGIPNAFLYDSAKRFEDALPD